MSTYVAHKDNFTTSSDIIIFSLQRNFSLCACRTCLKLPPRLD